MSRYRVGSGGPDVYLQADESGVRVPAPEQSWQVRIDTGLRTLQ